MSKRSVQMTVDDKTRHYHVDTQRMIDSVSQIPRQIETMWEAAAGFRSAAAVRGPLVISGLGGSSIGGRLIKDLIGRACRIPIALERGYALDAAYGPGTTVVCASYSGNTEEVLGVFDDARSKGAGLAVVTSGGKLAERAATAGVPVCAVPGGLPPRAAIGYLYTALLRFVSNAGVHPVSDAEVAAAVEKGAKLARRYGLDGDLAENTALQLAKRLYGKVPLVYSGDGLLAGTAYRWKCQINENSKTMAFCNVFPELGHNEVMGWDCPERLREELFLVMLRDIDEHPRVAKRMDATYEMLEPLAGGAAVITSVGTAGRAGSLSRLLSVLLLGDFMSVYLAVEYGKDPTPIEKIEQIKKMLGSEVP
jgi:glucose/mannose-6-phosphate isomerase